MCLGWEEPKAVGAVKADHILVLCKQEPHAPPALVTVVYHLQI